MLSLESKLGEEPSVLAITVALLEDLAESSLGGLAVTLGERFEGDDLLNVSNNVVLLSVGEVVASGHQV